MCYNIAIFRTKEELELRFKSKFIDPQKYNLFYHVSSFSLPQVPVITNEDPEHIQLFTWGIIPFWVKNREDADAIRVKTMNARGESIYEKPSFRAAAEKQHCLVLVDGFYEWREFHGINYPYYIRLKSGESFALAGLWEQWMDSVSDEQIFTFSIVTTKANPLMEQIHNKKKRMPVILPKELERFWISDSLSKNQMQQLLIPYDDSQMEAYTVSRLITARDRNSNIPKVMDRYSYPELRVDNTQQPLF
ncbi:MAG: SOS response-associated peptidase [Candidatus Thermoplasmatota archaeon]|nr:SOS response-associated peptidase [Candidatus Thermoplasmatota archaeon]MBU1941118.1 SOS response-associated peptidase [Candidatus Thermoplasmatota archaeon]